MTRSALLLAVAIAACQTVDPAPRERPVDPRQPERPVDPQPRDPAVAPSACPRPGPLATGIAKLRDDNQGYDPLASLFSVAAPHQVAVALADALGCADRAFRLVLLSVLQREGAEVAAALPAIARWIDDPDRETRVAALLALRYVGAGGDSPAGDGVRALLARLAHVDRGEQPELLVALGDLRSPDAYPRLALALRDPDVAHRRAAIEALAPLVRSHAAVLPDVFTILTTATADRDPQVRSYAFFEIGELRDARAVRFLSARLDRSGPDQAGVVNALAACGRLARPVQARLAALVRSDVDMALRTAAAGALGTIGADSPAALDALAVALTMPGEFLIESMPSDGREDLRSSAWTGSLHTIMQRGFLPSA